MTADEIFKNTYLFLVHYNISIDQYVVEQEKLSRLGLLPTHLCQDTFSHQNSAGYREWLTRQRILIFIRVCMNHRDVMQQLITANITNLTRQK